MRLLPESVRKKLGMSRHAVSGKPDEWVPVFEESQGRRLSAPARWLCAVTDVGMRRNNNEDQYFLSSDCRLWVVADGMGGHAAGEIASALTIQAIVASIDSAGREPGAEAGARPDDLLLRAFDSAQDLVSSQGLKDEECRGMGSTVIAGITEGESVHICHVGDVRGYHLSEGQLTRITNDHSLVWELVMSGLLTADEARVHPQRAKVTQAIGKMRGIKPDFATLTLKPKDRVLLCSDGLWEALPDQDIGKLISADGSMRDLASVLVNKVNEAGGEDNITVVLYEHAAGRTALVKPKENRRDS